MNKKLILILSILFILIVSTLGLVWYLTTSNSSVPLDQQSKDNQSPSQTQLNDQSSLVAPGSGTQDRILDTGSDSADQLSNGSDTAALSDKNDQLLAVGGAVRLTETEVFGAASYITGESINYLDRKGALYRADILPSDNSFVLSAPKDLQIAPMSNIEKILWPSSGNAFIAQTKDIAGKKKFHYFSGDENKYYPLPDSVISLDWVGGDSKIGYIWQAKNGEVTLNTSNPDGTNFVSVAKINYGDVEVKAAPDGKNFLFYRTANTTSNNKIFLVSGDGKLFKTVIADGYNIGVNWSPNSSNFIFAKRTGGGEYVLWLGNSSGNDPKSLGIASYTDRVTWSKDGAFIVAAGYEMKGEQKDTKQKIFKVDIRSMTKTSHELVSSVDPRELFLNLKEDKVLFKNAFGGELYYLSLLQKSESKSPAVNVLGR